MLLTQSFIVSLLIIIDVTTANYKLLLPPVIYPGARDLIKFADHINKLECKILCGRMTAVISDTNELLSHILIRHLNNMRHIPNIIASGHITEIVQGYGTSQIGVSDLNFIIIENENFANFTLMIKHLSKLSFIVKRTNTLVIICELLNPNEVAKSIEEMLKYLWHKKYPNSIITYFNQESQKVNALAYVALGKSYVKNLTKMEERGELRNYFENKLDRRELAGHRINIYSFGNNNRKYGINVTGRYLNEGTVY